MKKLGIDIGSTTVKVALLGESNEILYSDYRRHYADIQETLSGLLSTALSEIGESEVHPMITGSGGLTLAKHLQIPFNQEVIAVSTALRTLAPKTDVAIELGGEDAKIIYFEGGNVEQRMNGVCAGGTGSFIDQMAALLQTDAIGLNTYAKDYHSLYTIAARCGVFAKSDIQPLINDGASREDLSASIFQAVVNQTISGLACGKPIRGHVAFLGGPLHFLSELRAAFIRTLKLDDEHTIIPENSHLYAAIGSAMNADPEVSVSLTEVQKRLAGKIKLEFEVERMQPLFASHEEYEAFSERHGRDIVRKGDLADYHGDCFLGIDAGSTTTKTALIDKDGTLLYSFYANNQGDPLSTAIRSIQEIYSLLPDGARIVRACSTGYGEALLKAALNLDEGEVETIAHYFAAAYFDPSVDCILDIGGQDMKCIRIKDGSVDSVLLNEACSSGCGSFIENFANSLNFSVRDFAKEALFAEHPIDLGTRCTVFMNSKVKQAQKEGASVADISAGLAYSVIKNALYKVIKVSSASALGSHIVVQGGTFYNDAVLRSFERIADCDAIRPDIAGIMGAFGAALVARSHYHSGDSTCMLSIDEINALTTRTTMVTCNGCTNHCRLTVNHFSDGRKYISGNRCERGLGKERTHTDVPNMFAWKNERLFSYTPLTGSTKGRVGIPRVLNIYENYPLWFRFFTELGYEVVLSPPSTHEIYELGIESIPSESECYPAKLAHGHIEWLIREGVDFIFYPCIPYERTEFTDAGNHYNCPIVTSYAENIRNNVESITRGQVRFYDPFLPLTDEVAFTKSLIPYMQANFGISPIVLKHAAQLGWKELEKFREDTYKKGQEVLAWILENNRHGIVLAGRPYHIDLEINHGIPELITSYGIAVLTEDAISNLGNLERPIIVMDQWMYHSRLYAAANYVKTRDDLDLIQLNSFGCGLDAVTTDQVQDILNGSDKIYTCLKIDEVNNLGAARIRVRSLLSAIRIRKEKNESRTLMPASIVKEPFTQSMRKEYTIIAPQMSPIHFRLLEPAFKRSGYNLKILQNDNKEAVNIGLQYVNNDACYPSLMVTGQIMEAILSGEYDTNKLAVLITQTGGGCRATNYIAFIRRALKKAGYGHIPVLSLNVSGLEKQKGFKLTAGLVIRGIYGVVIGDIFMRCLYRVRPYEAIPGSANELYEKWNAEAIRFVSRTYPSRAGMRRICRQIIEDFDRLPLADIEKPRVGVVGEILVKFLPAANNYLVDLLEAEGAEAVVPDLLDFIAYTFYNGNFKTKYLGFGKKTARIGNLGIKLLDWLRKPAREAFLKSKRFEPPADIAELAKLAEPIVSIGNQCGEGWFLTGEMMELIHSGAPNIVCCQPFACLPNHIVGKGVIKNIRSRYPDANIVAVDYDPGASEVNQLNRIKLMLSTAFRNLEEHSSQSE